MAKAKPFRTACWWALVGPRGLPVIFSTRPQAVENREPDEVIWCVAVVPLERRPRANTGRKT
jgi:hypothetical protein